MVNFIHHSIICTYLQTVYLTLNVLEKEVIDADYTFLIMHISLVYKTKNKQYMISIVKYYIIKRLSKRY